MTTLAEMIDMVDGITNRTDLVKETKLAIKSATLREHAAVDYSKDLMLTSIALSPGSPDTFRYLIPAASIRARKITPKIYETPVVQVSSAYTNLGVYGLIELNEVSAFNIFDTYRLEHYNYWYNTASGIHISAVRSLASVDILYYKYTDVTDSGYSSWIADEFPYVIADFAAIEIFRLLGRTAEQNAYTVKAKENRLTLIASNITAIG